MRAPALTRLIIRRAMLVAALLAFATIVIAISIADEHDNPPATYRDCRPGDRIA